jgi:Tfp pilus assembly protein PilN
MKRTRSSGYVLGMIATSRAVHAVLLAGGPDGPEVLRRFSRQRARSVSGSPQSVPVGVTEGTQEDFSSSSDFTIQFGDSSGSGKDLFLSSEFVGLDGEDGEESGSGNAPVSTFELEFRDIIEECEANGYRDPAIAFTLAAADIFMFELRMPDRPRGKRPEREALIDLLAEQFKGVFDEERVIFLPLGSGEEGPRRQLAIFPKGTDPVTATLGLLSAQRERLPAVQLLDVEVGQLIGLTRLALQHANAYPSEETESEDDEFAPSVATPDGPPNTLVVRAGFEDTLVLFMQGDTVLHCESLRSLTAFDAPETICSRILLQQDEHAVGDIHRVLLVSEEREQDLVETFEMFFPDSRVETLRSYLPKSVGDATEGSSAAVVATGAALRLFGGPEVDGAFERINLLPRKLLRRRVRLPITWPAIALAMLIGLTTVFFATTYSRADQEIATYRDRLGQLAVEEIHMDVATLQASIDSMQQLYATYTRALQVLDTLLVGSDRWSRILEKTAREASGVKGIWIENMRPQGGRLTLTGNATSRDKIVQFAERTGAEIETLTFSEIRDWPVYAFGLQIRIEDELPAAARYLRERAGQEEALAGPGVVNVQSGTQPQDRGGVR